MTINSKKDVSEGRYPFLVYYIFSFLNLNRSSFGIFSRVY